MADPISSRLIVEAARLVLDKMPHVKFVMAGTGDMLPA